MARSTRSLPSSQFFATNMGQNRQQPIPLGQLTVPFIPGPNNNPNYGCSEGIEFIGFVKPSDYKGKITLRRDLLSRKTYAWDSLSRQTPPTTASGIQPFDSEGMADDTSLTDYLTKSIQADGNIYDLDAPEPQPTTSGIVDDYRGNFREYAQLGDWKRFDFDSPLEQASPDFFWFARMSCVTSDGTNYTFDDSYESQRDNAAGGANGPTRTDGTNCTPTSIDLSGACN